MPIPIFIHFSEEYIFLIQSSSLPLLWFCRLLSEYGIYIYSGFVSIFIYAPIYDLLFTWFIVHFFYLVCRHLTVKHCWNQGVLLITFFMSITDYLPLLLLPHNIITFTLYLSTYLDSPRITWTLKNLPHGIQFKVSLIYSSSLRQKTFFSYLLEMHSVPS